MKKRILALLCALVLLLGGLLPAWASQSAANLRAASVLTGAGKMNASLTRGEAAQLLCAMLEYRDEQKTGWFGA